MVAGAMMRSTLLGFANKLLVRGFRRWHTAATKLTLARTREQELALTILDLTLSRRVAQRKAQLLQRWKRAATRKALESHKEKALASLNEQLANQAAEKERALVMSSAMRVMFKAGMRSKFRRWALQVHRMKLREQGVRKLVFMIQRATARRVAAAKGSSASGAARASSMRHGGVQAAWFLWRHLVNTQKLSEKLRKLERTAAALGSLRKVIRKTDVFSTRKAFGIWRSHIADQSALIKQLRLTSLAGIDALLRGRLRGMVSRRFGQWLAATQVAKMQAVSTATTSAMQEEHLTNLRQVRVSFLWCGVYDVVNQFVSSQSVCSDRVAESVCIYGFRSAQGQSSLEDMAGICECRCTLCRQLASAGSDDVAQRCVHRALAVLRDCLPFLASLHRSNRRY